MRLHWVLRSEHFSDGGHEDRGLPADQPVYVLADEVGRRPSGGRGGELVDEGDGAVGQRGAHEQRHAFDQLAEQLLALGVHVALVPLHPLLPRPSVTHCRLACSCIGRRVPWLERPLVFERGPLVDQRPEDAQVFDRLR